MSMELYPKKVLTSFLYLILFLLAANIAGIISKHFLGHGSLFGVIPMFDFDDEQNIPTLFSSFAILLSSILLSVIAYTQKKLGSPYISWLILAVIFLFLSIDEISLIHERLAIILRGTLNTSGIFYYAWVIPYGIALIAFVALYAKFLFRLPKNIMYLFILSGTIYVTGVLGFELLGGMESTAHNEATLKFSILYTLEELFEMVGIAIFIYTLLLYMVTEYKFFTLTIKKQGN